MIYIKHKTTLSMRNLIVFSVLVLVLATLLHNNSFGQTLNNGKILFDLDKAVQTKSKQVETVISKTEKDLVYKNDSGISSITSKPLSVPLEEFGEFIAFGLTILHNEIYSKIKVQVRSSVDNENWDNWSEFKQMDLIEEETNIYRSELYFLERDARFIQFKVSTDKKTDSLFLNKISLFFSSPLPKTEMKRGNKLQLNNAIDTPEASSKIFSRPLFVYRKEWGCPQAENNIEMELTAVTHLVIHHSAGANSASDYAAVVLSYWDYHVNGNGWADIGYNWLVDPHGVVYKGRAWYDEDNENVKGAHNSGKNSGTAGLCLIGNYTGDIIPTSDMWEATWDMLAFLCDKYSLDPLGVSYHSAIDKDNDVITGHRDSGGGTECPGDISFSYDATRQAVADKLAGTYAQGPINMKSKTFDCSNKEVQFSWENSGSGWQINVSEDPSFSNHYVKWVSDLTSYTGPHGFVLAPEQTEPLSSFKDGTRYFWRIYYQDRKTPTYSYTMSSCSPSLISTPLQEELSLKVYPNPSNGSFKIIADKETYCEYGISLFNLTGQEVFNKKSNNTEIDIKLPGLAAGLYILKIEANNNQIIRQLVILD